MKALSVKQPHASWLADGLKGIETRTWRTNHRGPLLICAGKTIDKRFFDGNDDRTRLMGVALCIVDIIECRPMRQEDEERAMCGFLPGFFAWVVGSVKPIKPFPVKGQLGLFDVGFPRETEDITVEAGWL